MSTDGPGFVIQVKDRRHRNDVHVGFVVGLERSHIAPVQSFFLILVHKIEGVDAIIVDHLGQDVFAKIMAGALIFRVL